MKTEKTPPITSNMEDYLEAIACLKKQNKIVRVKDIGRLMQVKTPSVNNAVNVLAEKGFVQHERYGCVELTSAGNKIASAVQKRHDVLTSFLTDVLDVNEKIASEDACRMEHAISATTMKRLMAFLEKNT